MNGKQKTVIFLGDGMADEPLAELGGKTPLQHAKTPAMDSIAARGASGTLLTLPQGFPTSSDVANMSVLGCDLASEYCGRGVLEAVSRGVALGADDLALRCNLVRAGADGRLEDFSAGHIAQADAQKALALLQAELGSQSVSFHPGVSYRNILVLRGNGFSKDVACEKPDDHAGGEIAANLPRAVESAGVAAEEAARRARTAETLRTLIARAAQILPALGGPANAIWPWSPGRAGAVKTLAEKYGITSAVISAVDVINGLGKCLGMEVVSVPGATGYIDTDYEAKADAAAAAVRRCDMVFVHVEAMDEVSHARDLALKIRAIEDFDSRLVARVMAACGGAVRYAVLPDHPAPVSLGKHTRSPVPVALCGSCHAPDAVRAFGETEAARGALGAMRGADFMNALWA